MTTTNKVSTTDRNSDVEVLKVIVKRYGILNVVRMLTGISTFGQGRPSPETSEDQELERRVRNELRSVVKHEDFKYKRSA